MELRVTKWEWRVFPHSQECGNVEGTFKSKENSLRGLKCRKDLVGE